ncbi:glycogen debranching enzyme [Clostridium sp. CAG:356]|jgi:alpha,alpha-trehalase|nr:glycogen debranching enzyme [Clostridium sp. CAG:356]
MKYSKEELNLENGLKKEWLVTNGIGGFASSTIIGTNTRKYHGLLVVPIIPPARRRLILSKIDESIIIDKRKYELFTNVGKNYISQGYKYQISFEKSMLPVFQYKVEDVEITKIICMEHFKNTVGVYYKIKNGKKSSKLILTPVMNFRNAHGINKNHIFKVEQKVKGQKLELKIDDGNPIYIKINDGKYIEHHNDTFFNMFYIEEEKRGFEAEENHTVPGRYEIELEPGEEKEVSFICSTEENIEEIDARALIVKEKARLNKIIIESKLINTEKLDKTKEEKERDELIKEFLIATDNFIIKRPLFNTYSAIAGYPWFLDWMRDTLISYEGLFLKTKRFDNAKKVLQHCIRDIKYGLIPNTYSEDDYRPLYNSVDASLLFFEQVKKYLEYTENYEFIMQEIYPKMENIIENYSKGIDLDNNNIYMDYDGLISSGTEMTQNTWMDAKYAGIAVTPRNGKAVEINAMWYNALKIMQELAIKNNENDKAKKYEKMAKKCKKSYQEKFYNKRRKCLYDVLGDSKIRPNQLFALSLTYPVLEPTSEEAQNMVETVTKKLLNNYGLKSLAKGEENYVEIYEGDSCRRDFSYHQGITWTWLLGPYYNALKRLAKESKNKADRTKFEEQLKEFTANVIKTFKIELNERGCVGSIAEIYDSKRPYEPKGAIAQAWSVAEVFRIISEN